MAAWTQELADQALALRAAGLTTGQIAERFERSEDAIRTLFRRIRNGRRMGRPNPWSDADIAKLTTLHDAGTPVRDMVEAMGRSESVIRRQLAVMYGPRSGATPRRGLKETVIAMHDAGETRAAIAKKLNASRGYVDYTLAINRTGDEQQRASAELRAANMVHLEALRRAGHGFPIVSDFLMRRLAQLEWAPKPRVLFA